MPNPFCLTCCSETEVHLIQRAQAFHSGPARDYLVFFTKMPRCAGSPHRVSTCFEAAECGDGKLAIQRQAAGRSLRMRKRPKTMKKGDLFPAKRVVIAAIGGFGAAPNPPAADRPFNPDNSDEEEVEEEELVPAPAP